MIRYFALSAFVVWIGAVNDAQAQVLDVIEQANRYTIKITTAIDYPFGVDKKGSSRGSGFLVDKERGWFLTNAHVASKSPSSIRASFKDRPYVGVEKVYVDNHLDLAVIKMDPSKIPSTAEPAKLQCEGEAQAGRAVIAYGQAQSEPSGKPALVLPPISLVPKSTKAEFPKCNKNREDSYFILDVSFS